MPRPSRSLHQREGNMMGFEMVVQRRLLCGVFCLACSWTRGFRSTQSRNQWYTKTHYNVTNLGNLNNLHAIFIASVFAIATKPGNSTLITSPISMTEVPLSRCTYTNRFHPPVLQLISILLSQCTHRSIPRIFSHSPSWS